MNTKKNKIAIAIIIPGGIGTGENNIGVPVMEQLIKLLSSEFDITVFSLFKVNASYVPLGFELVEVCSSNTILRTLKFFSVFRSFHKRKEFQAVHGFWALPSGLLAVLSGQFFKIKSLVSVLGGDATALPQIQYGQLLKWLPRRLALWTLSNANQVICLTNYLLKNLREVGLKRGDIKIIPWGVDVSIFKFHDKQLTYPLKFLHVANLSPVKDQFTLLRAFKIINEQVPSILTIIGEGVLEEPVKELTLELNLQDHVVFKNFMPYTELPLQYQQANILLHTSLSEGQSEVVTEAMSCGTIVAGTRVGLLYDLPDCCVAVGIGDYRSLGQAVLSIIQDVGKMKEIQKRAQDWASAHSIRWTVEQMRESYEA